MMRVLRNICVKWRRRQRNCGECYQPWRFPRPQFHVKGLALLTVITSFSNLHPTVDEGFLNKGVW